MPKCPNCGLETARTEDWACQWCGHPLLSKGYKKIPKTYRELQEERYPHKPPARVAPEAEPEPGTQPESELKAVPEFKPAVDPAPEAISEPQPEPEPEPESVLDPELEPATESAPEPEPEPAPEPEPEPTPVSEAPPEPAAATASAAEPKLEPDPETGVIAASVEELNAAFNADKPATNAKLANKLLQVTGTVDKIIVKDYLDIQYILLTSRQGRWQVRCTFGREHAPKLTRLAAGETVTVQGNYDGCERNIILKDCTLVG